MSQFSKEEILNIVQNALETKGFIPFYQPQFNNYTGLLVGSEALARMKDYTYEQLPPSKFIPVLEENHLISQLDKCIFEQVCIFLAKCIKENAHLAPISINLSREDIYLDRYIEDLEEIRKQYDIPVKYLRIEVTESIAGEGKEAAIAVVDKLHDLGYVVELDDFGSGYSSLNVLKDIDYDILKLDMGFLNEDLKGKGGTIISSIARMAKWLKMPVIVEGVQTKEQADFIKSIGCEYSQGFYFSRAISEEAYYQLISQSNIGLATNSSSFKETVNPVSFWSEKSLDTLVFNSYVGAACVFNFNANKQIEVLRVNKKYIQEIGMNMNEHDVINSDIYDTMDDNNKQIYLNTLQRAIDTKEEQECETWCTIKSACCGSEKLCIRHNVILIGQSENEYIFYESIRNITAEKIQISEGKDYEDKFKNVTEQANIYYWEYTVATKEMRPCFRCMRDLGLPPLVTNYPEPAIEQGIFPADYADMYRDWHKQIASGKVKHLEAIIPLTVGRVPFHVRYDVEFDELNRPVKANGSATFVTDAEMQAYFAKNKQ